MGRDDRGRASFEFFKFFSRYFLLYFEKHKFRGLVGPPAGIFEKSNNLQNQEKNFWCSKMALNQVLTVPEYSRHWDLSESCLNIFYLPIFDRFMAYRRSKKNFGPNVIYCFLGFNGNKLKHKFHGLVGPPAGIFEENNNLQNQEEKVWI